VPKGGCKPEEEYVTRDNDLPKRMKVARDVMWRLVDVFKRDVYSELRDDPDLDVLDIIEYVLSEKGLGRKLKGFYNEMKFYLWVLEERAHWRIGPMHEFLPDPAPDFQIIVSGDEPEWFDLGDEVPDMVWHFFVDVKNRPIGKNKSLSSLAKRYSPLIVATESRKGWDLDPYLID